MSEFFNGLSPYDIAYGSFMVGFLTHLFFGLLISLSNLILERALYFRKLRKEN